LIGVIKPWVRFRKSGFVRTTALFHGRATMKLVTASRSGGEGRAATTRFTPVSLDIDFRGGTLSTIVVRLGAAVLMVLAGMIWGIVTGISQDHSTMPAHAHLHLLGWVSLFLFGMYYGLHPAVDDSHPTDTTREITPDQWAHPDEER
jgi:hypothetical protein